MRTDVAAILKAAGEPVGVARAPIASSWNEHADPVGDIRAAIAALKDPKRQAEVDAQNARIAHWNAMRELQLIEALNWRSCSLERADLLLRSGHKPTEEDMARARQALDAAEARAAQMGAI